MPRFIHPVVLTGDLLGNQKLGLKCVFGVEFARTYPFLLGTQAISRVYPLASLRMIKAMIRSHFAWLVRR